MLGVPCGCVPGTLGIGCWVASARALRGVEASYTPGASAEVCTALRFRDSGARVTWCFGGLNSVYKGTQLSGLWPVAEGPALARTHCAGYCAQYAKAGLARPARLRGGVKCS